MSTATDPRMFWGELAPCDHLVQIYDDETRFMETLERFIGDGLASGDGAIVIATAPIAYGFASARRGDVTGTTPRAFPRWKS